jgi:hypothetical protein
MGPGSNVAGGGAASGVAARPACGRCGSFELRRSHSRGTLQRLIRRNTSWDRYACRSCGHRGWARGQFVAHGERPEALRARIARADTPTGRRPETRDHRLKRKVRVQTSMAILLSLLLGILAALSLQRCGLPAPPLE